MVSILVFVELALDAFGMAFFALALRVSILVFVELALDVLDDYKQNDDMDASFNPCFRGTCS